MVRTHSHEIKFFFFFFLLLLFMGNISYSKTAESVLVDNIQKKPNRTKKRKRKKRLWLKPTLFRQKDWYRGIYTSMQKYPELSVAPVKAFQKGRSPSVGFSNQPEQSNPAAPPTPAPPHFLHLKQSLTFPHVKTQTVPPQCHQCTAAPRLWKRQAGDGGWNSSIYTPPPLPTPHKPPRPRPPTWLMTQVIFINKLPLQCLLLHLLLFSHHQAWKDDNYH